MDTIFGWSPIDGARRRVGRGRKKKWRRKVRAHKKDGWQRKRAGVGMAPQRRPSKTLLKGDLRDEGL